MALIFAGESVIGRVRLDQPLVTNQSYILRFPDKGLGDVRFEGTWELLRFNTPLGLFVQVLAVPLWVDAHFIAGSNIPNTNHRMSWVWRYEGISYELHSA